jgi:hypothetical protein
MKEQYFPPTTNQSNPLLAPICPRVSLPESSAPFAHPLCSCACHRGSWEGGLAQAVAGRAGRWMRAVLKGRGPHTVRFPNQSERHKTGCFWKPKQPGNSLKYRKEGNIEKQHYCTRRGESVRPIVLKPSSDSRALPREEIGRPVAASIPPPCGCARWLP